MVELDRVADGLSKGKGKICNLKGDEYHKGYWTSIVKANKYVKQTMGIFTNE